MNKSWSCILLVLLLLPISTLAQTPAAQSQEKKVDIFETIDVNTIPSLVFTDSEHQEIIVARRAIGIVKTPEKNIRNQAATPTGEREIHLQGIMYTSSNDWVVWLNGRQISPNALPEEALDFKVYRGYIEVKWYDDFTNQIIPIRLKPLQRFNIDSRIFLPG